LLHHHAGRNLNQACRFLTELCRNRNGRHRIELAIARLASDQGHSLADSTAFARCIANVGCRAFSAFSRSLAFQEAYEMLEEVVLRTNFPDEYRATIKRLESGLEA